MPLHLSGASPSRPKSRISELAALAEAPPALTAIIDVIGLGLSYQLLRQWRAHAQATLDFLAQMPVEHISRLTIATIGAPGDVDGDDGVAPPPAAAEATAEPSASAVRSGRNGGGASPRAPGVSASAPETVSPGTTLDPDSHARAVGALLVEHEDHGRGQILFGLAVAPDHLAVRFADGGQAIYHKDAVRIVATRAVDDAG